MVCAINRANSNSRTPGGRSSGQSDRSSGPVDRPGGARLIGRPSHRAVPIAVTYAAVAAFWILMSDGLLQWAFGDMPAIPFIHPLKGLLFILVTSLLLHRLIR